MVQAVIQTTVTGLQGNPIASTPTPTGNQALVWNGTAWAPAGPYLSTAGGTLTGALTLAANAGSALQPVTLQQLQAGYLPIAGGTITGNLTVSGATATAITGVTNGSNAGSGQVGEVLQAPLPSTVTIGADNTWAQLLSLNLTAGDWDVVAAGSMTTTAGSPAGNGTNFGFSLNLQGETGGQGYYVSNVGGATMNFFAATIAQRRIILSAAAAVSLWGLCNAPGVSKTVQSGYILARRVR